MIFVAEEEWGKEVPMNAKNEPRVEFLKEHQGTQESTFKSLQINHKVMLYTVTQVVPH